MVDNYKHGALARNVVHVFLRDPCLDGESLKQPPDQRAVRVRLPQIFIDRRDSPKTQNPFDDSCNRPRHRFGDEARQIGIA